MTKNEIRKALAEKLDRMTEGLRANIEALAQEPGAGIGVVKGPLGDDQDLIQRISEQHKECMALSEIAGQVVEMTYPDVSTFAQGPGLS